MIRNSTFPFYQRRKREERMSVQVVVLQFKYIFCLYICRVVAKTRYVMLIVYYIAVSLKT